VTAKAIIPSADCKPVVASRGCRSLTYAELAESVPRVEDWDRKRFRLDRKLQDAVRNQGDVVLMEDTLAETGGEFARVAVKRMPNSWIQESSSRFAAKHAHATERPWQDIACVRRLNEAHYPHVCELLGVFRDEKTTYVVTSLCTEGDLFTWCSTSPAPGPDLLPIIFPVVVQILDAVSWLHEFSIVHRDVSLENILITKRRDGLPMVKLIDFGMSTVSRWSRKEVRGKLLYQAPEMHSVEEYDGFLTDAFAVGVTIYSLTAKDYPWSGTKRGECKCFDYVRTYGLRTFCERRKAGSKHQSNKIKVVMGFFSEPPSSSWRD
jgi:serine/threonine protein kinase